MSDLRSGRLVFPLQLVLMAFLVSSILLIVSTADLFEIRHRLSLAEQELIEVKSHILERERVVELVRAVSQHRDFLDNMENRLTRRTTQSELVEDIERMLARRNIVVEDQSYSPVIIKNGERNVRQTMQLRSDYRALRGFVAALEDSSRGITVVEQIDIQKSDTDVLATSIQLTSFLGQE